MFILAFHAAMNGDHIVLDFEFVGYTKLPPTYNIWLLLSISSTAGLVGLRPFPPTTLSLPNKLQYLPLIFHAAI